MCYEKVKPNLWNCYKTYSWLERSGEGNWKNTVFHFTHIIFFNRISWQHSWLKKKKDLLNVLICCIYSINNPQKGYSSSRKSTWTTILFTLCYLKLSHYFQPFSDSSLSEKLQNIWYMPVHNARNLKIASKEMCFIRSIH